LGRIDALINNAGYGQYGLFEAIPRKKIRQQFDVNLFGAAPARVTSMTVKEQKRFTGGNWLDSASVKTFPSTNPIQERKNHETFL